jgi:hypothetical protein
MKHDEVVNNLLFNSFLDMRKKEINKHQRAKLLERYMENNNVSGRALAEQIGVPKSTLQDWLMINRISETEYNAYLDKGFSETEIYRMLRNNKKSAPKMFDECMVREQIRTTSDKLKSLINQGMHIEDNLIIEIKELVNILNRILLHNERRF